ncbi:MAG: hypothetical protein IT563_06870 [Alphaproteobacteria bacterium]|nr:hypothetical protein [Alphaproteobacteria bacterium]
MRQRVLLSGLALAALCIAPAARGESPLSHERDTLRYQWQAPPPPGANRKPSDIDPFVDPETQRGLSPADRQSQKRAPVDDGKREMVGKEKLWTTRDSPGQRGVFAFLDNKIGDPIETMFPDPEEKDQFGGLLCRDTPGLPGWLECTDDSLRQMVNGAWKLLYRGVEVSFINYRYFEHKLVGFRMGFPTANFEKLGEALKKQYGSPTGEEETSWQHRLGGVYDVKIMAWNTPVGEMTLRSRGASLDAGLLSLIEPKAEARYNDVRYRQVVLPERPATMSDDGFVIHPPKGPAVAAPGTDKPPGDKPAGDKPAGDKPAGDAPATPAATKPAL